MFANCAAILADENAIGIGMDLHRPTHSSGRHRVLVVVKAHRSLGDRRRHGMEAVKASGVGNQLRSLALEDLPHCLLRELRMPMGLGVGDALSVSQAFNSRVLEPQSGVKNRSRTTPTWFLTCPFSHPAAGVQATGSTVVAAHLQEAAVIAPVRPESRHCERRRLVSVQDITDAGRRTEGFVL